MKCAFTIVDVFADTPHQGNPVAVIFSEGTLADTTMQAFSAWNGQPETVFINLASHHQQHDYSARIFSPRAELKFAGHPSLGAAHAVSERAGYVRRNFPADNQWPDSGSLLRQYGKAGDVELRVVPGLGGNTCYVKTPSPATVRRASNKQQSSAAWALGLNVLPEVFIVEAGARWLLVKLAAPGMLESLRCNTALTLELSLATGTSGITAYEPCALDRDGQFEVRSFGPAIGVLEDAGCGGGNACLAALEAYLHDWRPGQQWLTRQGRYVNRDCRLALSGPVEDQRFWIGGRTRTMMTGLVSL